MTLMKIFMGIYIAVLMFLGAGCSQVVETGKSFWGSSTKALEEARIHAVSQNYACSFTECFETVLSLARDKTEKAAYDKWLGKNKEMDAQKEESDAQDPQRIPPPTGNGFFDIFIKDKTKRMIVVMGIAGNVDTTEVGLFFTRYSQDAMRVEVTSLSTSAKNRVAKAVFDLLDQHFASVN